MSRSGGLCIGCLLSTLVADVEVYCTPCCSRDLCSRCLQALTNCPICKIAIDRSRLGVPKSATQPPPYLGFPSLSSASLAAGDDDPPSYARDSQSNNGGYSDVQLQDAEALEPVPSYNAGGAASFLDVAELKTTDDGILAIHYVSNHDTLVGISMKYNVPVDEIRKANKMFSSNIHEREKLIIPGIHQLPKTLEHPSDEMKEEREKVRRAKRFQLTTKCADKDEAFFYLEEFEFDVDKAIARYLEDVEWERTHKPPGGYGQSSHRKPHPPQSMKAVGTFPSKSPPKGKSPFIFF